MKDVLIDDALVIIESQRQQVHNVVNVIHSSAQRHPVNDDSQPDPARFK